MDAQYLKECLGNCLVEGLAQVAQRQPADPIDFLACWIYRYKRNLNEEEKRKIESTQVEREREEALAELERIEKLKAEECQMAQKYEEQQKKRTEGRGGNLPEENETTEFKQEVLEGTPDPSELNTAKDGPQETLQGLSDAVSLQEALPEPIPGEDLRHISDDEGETQSEHSEESENEEDTQTRGSTPDEEYKSGHGLNSE